MDELKLKAQPKYMELIEYSERQCKELAKQNELLSIQNDLSDTNIVLLDRLCTLKEAQQESDDNFRDTWWKRKIRETRGDMIVLFVMVAGVGLDMIKVNGNSSVIMWLSNLFGV